MGAAAIIRYLAMPLRTAPLLLIGTFSILLVVAAKALSTTPSKGVTFAGLPHPSPTILVCQNADARL